jgi:hypothetical protein
LQLLASRRGAHQRLPCCIEPAEHAHAGRRHIGVAYHVRIVIGIIVPLAVMQRKCTSKPTTGKVVQ